MAKRKITHCILTFSLFLLIIISGASFSMARQFPIGVIFHEDTLYRSDARGDNWCITWVADDSQITSMCDGNWLKGKHSYHNHLYHITGGPEGFSRTDIPNYPQFVSGTGSWFGYGIVSVDGVVYSVVSKTPANRWSGPFRGIKMKNEEGRSHSVNYKWNHMKITIQIK